MSEGDFDYKKDLSIDEFALDLEWGRQPSLMGEWTDLLSEAIKFRDSLKRDLDREKARAEKEVRTSPKAFGIEKVTDRAIECEVLLNEKINSIISNYIEAQFRANLLKGAVSSLEHKKTALEWISKLYLKNYYSEPFTDMEDREKLDTNLSDKQTDRLNEAIRLRKNK